MFPESDRAVAEQGAPLLFMFMSDTEAGVLKGYGMKKEGKDLIATELWTVNLMKDSQTITNVVAKRQSGNFTEGDLFLGLKIVLMSLEILHRSTISIIGDVLDTDKILKKGAGLDI